MSERRPAYGRRVKLPDVPKAPSPPEEPLRGIEPGKFVCQMCGKTFQTQSGLKRHLENMHGTPERLL